MGIYTKAVASLQRGRTVELAVTQLEPKVPKGTLLTFKPVKADTVLKPGDIVLCRVEDRERILFVKTISVGRIKLATATKPLDGWVSAASIFGVS